MGNDGADGLATLNVVDGADKSGAYLEGAQGNDGRHGVRVQDALLCLQGQALGREACLREDAPHDVGKRVWAPGLANGCRLACRCALTGQMGSRKRKTPCPARASG